MLAKLDFMEKDRSPVVVDIHKPFSLTTEFFIPANNIRESFSRRTCLPLPPTELIT
jgi:hypothetical protein